MSDLARRLGQLAPDLRGRLVEGQRLSDLVWFRVGGPAELLFSPQDEDDLAYFLARLPEDVPVTTIGLGSNLLVRDGGLPGVTIRLGRAFAAIEPRPGARLFAGAAAADRRVAMAAQEAGIGGFAFYFGVPGSIGGALRMNAGANGTETADRVVEVYGVDRTGARRTFARAEMGYSYRHSNAPEDVIFTGALFGGRAQDGDAIRAEMDGVARHREATQPVKARTGGSTFKNPPGHAAWKLIDEAGLRGFSIGGAQVSEMHCNFLLNTGGATGAEIEALGEEIRRRVREASGVELEWEIKRIGVGA
ncbi:UDP-N-acetylenolpyruvoylglucosamine reductase [Methylopila jiangsuensis]|uniref:UDP-N-acetylenolpyruvoylglucosamine reductase n=1 Tax=Methylopila jiangsuensis TaxID=586230 RepID=A0A9W6N371_9HYPH|nr:UDP-N-acetylmuramate dehydrogenase [Methylopila jiangsuensis]MDR6286267.1 UDP-N-acetylmuramate dehydrogenase [Methylopila jiangsuensis]GLK76030.1 UDP-N-acetylenolpyruvoylglucosamine reductase [Methylopila jiangsuensis]